MWRTGGASVPLVSWAPAWPLIGWWDDGHWSQWWGHINIIIGGHQCQGARGCQHQHLRVIEWPIRGESVASLTNQRRAIILMMGRGEIMIIHRHCLKSSSSHKSLNFSESQSVMGHMRGRTRDSGWERGSGALEQPGEWRKVMGWQTWQARNHFPPQHSWAEISIRPNSNNTWYAAWLAFSCSMSASKLHRSWGTPFMQFKVYLTHVSRSANDVDENGAIDQYEDREHLTM